MKKIIILLGILTLLNFYSFFLSCEKGGGENIITTVYAESQCANAWERGSTDDITILNIKTYLESKGITVVYISFLRLSNGPFCDACNCWYGRLIYVKILESDLEKIKKLGFSQE